MSTPSARDMLKALGQDGLGNEDVSQVSCITLWLPFVVKELVKVVEVVLGFPETTMFLSSCSRIVIALT